ncbi:MAG: hypothetical protein NT165_00045, partial [Candidatus Falkowbacteria bacterium]|nr:hypothetical protein [Candidatus Falkowbacteria bacterium]
YLLSTSSMLFDNTNWNIPQTTTVSAIDDQVVNGTRYATITIAVATSTSPEYTTSMSTTSTLTINDNDVAPVVTGGGGGGGGGSYTPPSTANATMYINSGALKTTSPQVTLSFSVGSDIKKMAISNTPDFLSASQEDFAATKSWTLLSGAGMKTVYAKFYNLSGTASAAITTTIELVDDSIITNEEPASNPTPSTTPKTTPATKPIMVKSSDLLSLKFTTYTFKDSDKDGLGDDLEALLATDPKNPDTDGDGFYDGLEIGNNYSPLGAGPITDEERAIARLHPQLLDSDRDGLPDAFEKALGTSFQKLDTNNDKIKDADSLKKGINPITGKKLKPSASLISRLKNKTLIEVKTGIALKVDAKGVLTLK